MTVQQYPVPFRSAAVIGYNVADQIAFGAAYSSAWSQGATLLDVPPVAPIGAQVWKLQSIGFSGVLQWYLGGVGAGASGAFGKLGKIIGGLLPATQPQATTFGSYGHTVQIGVPFVSPMRELPNPNLSVTLWDPASDPLPPVGSGAYTGVGLPVSGSLQLPTPVEIYPGDTIPVGLWITPSLIGVSSLNTGGGGIYTQWEMSLLNGKYTLTYDDGPP